jgi:hypothetical protein
MHNNFTFPFIDISAYVIQRSTQSLCTCHALCLVNILLTVFILYFYVIIASEHTADIYETGLKG